jgi:hypothetical protein
VSEFITNSEMLVQHLDNMPHHEVAAKLAKEAATVNSRFQLLNTQFDNYQNDMGNYYTYLNKMVLEREADRDKGNIDNKANTE